MIEGSPHRIRDLLLQRPLLAILLASTVSITLPAIAQPTSSDLQAAELSQYEQLLRTSVDAAEKACLSNTSTEQSRSLLLSWHAVLAQISSTAGVEKKTEEIRGAAHDLPASAQLIENDNIRNCINEKIKPIFAMAVQVFQPAAASAAWPDPIDFRFSFIRGPSQNPQVYTEFLRADLQTRTGPLSDRLIIQDPQGAAYFNLRLGYPKPGEIVSGIIVAERIPNARLTAIQPVLTNVCFQRPSHLPSGLSARFDLFDCAEGKACRPSQRSTGWLSACPQPSPATKGWTAPFLGGTVYAASRDQPDTTAPVSPYWSVPSLRALTEGEAEGVGYTVFTLETDSFRKTDIRGVEVEVRVNGVAVREDGLTADLRPVANDPNGLFVHRFALQTLDFEGAQGGCDRIDIGLRPLMADGRKGDPLKSTLTYVALRDIAPRSQRLGDGNLKWSAAYITPIREWRNIAEINSYTYRTSDPAMHRSMVEQVQSDKSWLDKQGLTYEGQKIVGVIRPPRTVKPDGSAAYGLAAGLIQENGQVRFTFSDGDARKLAAFMIAQRSRGKVFARIIHNQEFIFQALGGSHTAGGVCEN